MVVPCFEVERVLGGQGLGLDRVGLRIEPVGDEGHLARNLGLASPGSAGVDDSKMLSALTDGTAETIESENRALSSALEKNFLDRASHEQAAMLLGAFALRVDSVGILVGCTTGFLLGAIGAVPPAIKAMRLSVAEGLKAV